MPIADDWNINYTTKQIYHSQWKDEINGTDASVAEIQTILCLAASSITTGDYFLLNSAKDETAYYVWYNKASGGGDPAPAGKTAIPVAIAVDDTDVEVATATATAIQAANNSQDFTAANGGGTLETVTVTNINKGSTTGASDSNTGFTFTVSTNGTGRTVFSVNALYSYLQDTFDELGQMDDKVPMSAQTPTDYTMINEWFIDEVSIKYLTGGAIKTDGWLRAEDSNTGIIQITYASGSPVGTDIGLAVVEETDGDTGTCLFIDTTRKKIWIRPASSAAANSFDSTSSHNIDFTTGTQDIPRTAAAAVSGENLWANVYTLGTIQASPYPQIYVFQNGSSISEWSTLSNWDRGHIDVLIRVKEMGTEIDGASVTVFARQGGNSYDHFSIDLTSGGRNAVPLSTATDLNYTTGDYYLLYDAQVDGANGAFAANEVIKHNAATSLWSAQIVSNTDWGTSGVLKLTNVNGTPSDNHPFKGLTSLATANVNGTLGDTYGTSSAEGTQLTIGLVCTGGTSTAKRILRGIQDDGATSKYVLQVSTVATGAARIPYYKDFSSGETITDSTTGSVTSGSASTTVVSGWDDITLAFVNGTVTFTDGSGSFTYGEKVTFTGGTGIVLYNSANGSATGTLTLGNMTITAINGLVITGAKSSAVATASQALQSAHTINQQFTQQTAYPYDIVVNGGGIYNTGRTLANVYEYLKFVTQENSTFNMYTVVSGTITSLDGEEYIQAYTGYTPVKSAPFGTFAGGTFFGAQGVWIEGMASNQSYQFIDSNGTSRQPYATITISVTSVVGGDRISVFRTSTGLVLKTMYTSHATSNAAGDSTFVIQEAIASDTPDTGVLRIVNTSANKEHRVRYSSWDSSSKTFTFPTAVTGTADTGDVTGTTLYDASGDFITNGILAGDILVNTTDSSWCQVITVAATTITHTPLFGGSNNFWTTADAYSFHTLPVTYDGTDTAYVPFIDETASTTSVSKTVLYNSARDVLIRVRKKGILPFETSGTVSSSGLSVSAIRTTDSIVT
jgi:hypothetical protein